MTLVEGGRFIQIRDSLSRATLGLNADELDVISNVMGCNSIADFLIKRDELEQAEFYLQRVDEFKADPAYLTGRNKIVDLLK